MVVVQKLEVGGECVVDVDGVDVADYHSALVLDLPPPPHVLTLGSRHTSALHVIEQGSYQAHSSPD